MITVLLKIIAKQSPQANKFHLANCHQFSNENLDFLSKNFTNIESIDFTNCNQLTDPFLSSFWESQDVSKIEFLSLQGCYLLSSQSIISLADQLDQRVSQLTHIDFSFCQYIEDDAFSLLILQCSELKSINIEYASGLSPQSIREIALHCPKLEKLNISGFPTLDDNVVASIAVKCKHLIDLKVSHCYRITSLSVEHIGKSCLHLKYLDISHCDKVSNSAILLLAGHCKQLQKLYITNLNIDSSSVNSLISRCSTNLKRLDIGSTAIDDSTLRYLLQYCNVLEELDISFCHHLSFDGILNFIRKSISLQKLFLWGHTFSSEQTKSFLDSNPSLIIERFSIGAPCNFNSLSEFNTSTINKL